MTTDKQFIANRLNALKSTDPKTIEGKAIVCQNALKHGILCKEVVLDEEEQFEFDGFRNSVLNQLQPIGEFEELLSDRIISCAWRLRRVIHIETAIFLMTTSSRIEKGSITKAFLHYSQTMAVLSRYETSIEKSFYKALAELTHLQNLRSQNGFVSQNAINQ
jgi:hypothetical protein